MGLFGGGNSSSSTTNNETQQTTTGGNQSSNVTLKADGSGATTLNMLDAGAVQGSLSLAQNIFAGALDHIALIDKKSIDSVNSANQNALNSVDSASQRLALAYQSGQAGDQTQLKYAGFILVGVGILALVFMVKARK